MGTEGGSTAVVPEHRDAGIGRSRAVIRSDVRRTEADGLAERLGAELEQAHVTIEDLNERVAELARANEELTAKLTAAARLRERAELELAELRAQSAGGKSEVDDASSVLRQELSLALEELQVMQEELQAAHDALSAAQPPPVAARG